MKIITLLLLFMSPLYTFALKSEDHLSSTEEGYFVFDSEKKLLPLLHQQDLNIDHINEKGFEIYGPHGLGTFLHDLGANFEDLTPHTKRWQSLIAEYPTPKEVQERVESLVKMNPDILEFEIIGKSHQGQDLYVVKVSDNVSFDEAEPEFKYIANMHGDEIVGRELMVLFLEDLVKRYREKDPKVLTAINHTEIFIMPTMNPDGSGNHRRGNGHHRDLNRNFPDFTTRDNINSPQGREPETQAVMNWQATRNFSLSANFHGGSKVVNYPWDTTAEQAPLTGLIKELSSHYAATVPGMFDNQYFPGGIVNGYSWYHIDGGMQDWSYYFHNDLQVTVELSNSKWPSYDRIPQFYEDNSQALLDYLLKVHQGAGFFLTDKNESGLVTLISDNGDKYGPYDFKNGEFHKILPLGNYTINVETKSGDQKTFKRVVTDSLPQ
jgi:hypothetical protein